MNPTYQLTVLHLTFLLCNKDPNVEHVANLIDHTQDKMPLTNNCDYQHNTAGNLCAYLSPKLVIMWVSLPNCEINYDSDQNCCQVHAKNFSDGCVFLSSYMSQLNANSLMDYNKTVPEKVCCQNCDLFLLIVTWNKVCGYLTRISWFDRKIANIGVSDPTCGPSIKC